MHRIPLYLQEKTIFWNRDICEVELFAKALNRGNVGDTEELFSILDNEALSFKDAQYRWAKNLYSETCQLLKDNDIKDNDITRVSYNFTKIILRAPPDSDAFVNALKLRGQIFIENQMIQRALNDFELLLYSGEKHLSNFDLCEVNGYLTICAYVISCLNKTKKYYNAYQRFKSLLPATAFQEHRLEKIERNIKKIEQQISQLDNTTAGLPKKDEYITPIDGFNSDAEIPLSSPLCYLDKIKNPLNPNEKGVFTSANIAKGKIVVVEHSFEIGVHTPLVQCELCFKREIFMYTCLKCRYKTYCSVTCLKNDIKQHSGECAGYQNGALLILDAVPLFRFFQRIANELSQTVFNRQSFINAQNAAYIWKNLPKAIAASMLYQRPPISLILNKPDYNKLNDRQYATLVATALRLTVFISRNTCIFENAFQKLSLSTKEKMLLTGCLLMRLQCHILLNTLDFEFNLLMDKGVEDSNGSGSSNSSKNNLPTPTSFSSPAAAAFSATYVDADDQAADNETDLETALANAEKKIACADLPPLKHANECHSITRLLSTYKDKIVMVCILHGSKDFLLYSEAAIVPMTENVAQTINLTLADMSAADRCVYMKNFANNFHENFVDYYLNVMRNNSCMPQVLSTFCMTLRKFRHACEPNVEVIFLDNGFIIGKTLTAVRQGEELVVSYKANHMLHPRDERRRYLQRLNIVCCCKRCEGPLDAEYISRRSRINCHNCGQEITYKCDTCKTYYTKELQRFRKELLLIQKKILAEKDATKLNSLYNWLYKLGRKNFSPSHETGIDVTLLYIKFLAQNDSHMQAFDMIFEVQNDILSAYALNEVWFTFYDSLLTIIKIILSNNINRPLETQLLPLKSLKLLCDLAQQINAGQKEYLKFYEIYDFHFKKIFEDEKLLTNWQNELLFANFKPTIEQLKQLQFNVDDDDAMPALMDDESN